MDDASEDTEQLVFLDWASAEDEAPTDPCRTLRARWKDSHSQLDAILAKRLEQIGHSEHGASKLLRERYKRAHAIMSDPDRAAEFHRERSRQIAEGTWAKLQYENGLYEGAVDEVFVEEYETELVRQGRGLTISANGDKYEGSYAADKRHGVGLQLFCSGDLYVGQWSEDNMHGLGVYYYGSGATYSGEFELGYRHGRGRLVWRNHSVYDGEFHWGVRTGNGVLEFCEGSGSRQGVYRGQFKDGLRHGEGSYEPTNPEASSSYVGQWVEDRLEGEGQANFPDGAEYTGAFLDGRPYGHGVYSWSEGSQDCTYEGQVKHGRITGRGKLDIAGLHFIHHRGPPRGWRVTYEGHLRNGEPDGYGELSGDMEYTGSWRNGLRDGRGSCSWRGTDCRFVGQFSEDQRHGTGRLIWRNGPVWEGNFNQDLRHGPAQWSANAEEQMHHAEEWKHGSLIMRDDVDCISADVNDIETHLEMIRSQGEQEGDLGSSSSSAVTS